MRPVDHFETFGLPRTWRIDKGDLEQRYLELSRTVHPDKFVDSTEKRVAMERAARVNEGYRTLRDPVKRAEFLVGLGGIHLDSSDPERGAPKMDAVFLADMNDFPKVNEVYGRFFTSEPPARATVQVSRLPRDVKVEIEAVAIAGATASTRSRKRSSTRARR